MSVLKIKEVAQKYKLTAATLRYYEEIDLLPRIERINGIRHYQPQDLERLEFILCLRNFHMPLEKMKEYFYLYDQGDATLSQRLALLEEQRAQTLAMLAQVQGSLAYLDRKITLTAGKLAESAAEKAVS